MRTILGVLIACGVAALAGCQGDGESVDRSEPVPAGAPTAPAVRFEPGAPASKGVAAEGIAPGRGLRLTEIFPHVRVDAEAGVVEFDGFTPIDAHDPETPDVYLELVACTKGTREHESLVSTEARPSHIHAALLLAGFESGSPGGNARRGADGSRIAAIEPTGDAVRVELVYAGEDGAEIVRDPRELIVHAETGEPLDSAGWVFGGSRFVEHRGAEVYDADGTGLLIGLATFGAPWLDGPTFGGETIGLAEVFSPESSVDEPVWIANRGLIARFGEGVVVRLSRGQTPQDTASRPGEEAE